MLLTLLLRLKAIRIAQTATVDEALTASRASNASVKVPGNDTRITGTTDLGEGTALGSFGLDASPLAELLRAKAISIALTAAVPEAATAAVGDVKVPLDGKVATAADGHRQGAHLAGELQVKLRARGTALKLGPVGDGAAVGATAKGRLRAGAALEGGPSGGNHRRARAAAVGERVAGAAGKVGSPCRRDHI